MLLRRYRAFAAYGYGCSRAYLISKGGAMADIVEEAIDTHVEVVEDAVCDIIDSFLP